MTVGRISEALSSFTIREFRELQFKKKEEKRRKSGRGPVRKKGNKCVSF
jgi:hypothetical protein